MSSSNQPFPQPAAPGGLVAVYLPEAVASGLQREAKTSRKSIEKMVAQWLEDQADYRAAAAVLKRVKAGKEQLHDAEEVYKRLGLR